MDRMELLKLALSTLKDPRQALDLAREMEAFINAKPLPDVAAVAVKTSVVAPAEAPAKVAPKKAAKRRKRGTYRKMTADERLMILDLWTNGTSWAELQRKTGRSYAHIAYTLRQAGAKFGRDLAGAASH